MAVPIFLDKKPKVENSMCVVKGCCGGLKVALGSCFGHFRCVFSACSPYASIIRLFRLHALQMLQGIELSRVEIDI